MADATPKPAIILHRCCVAPPPDTAPQSLPLTFFDLAWIYFQPSQRVLFYKFPCSHTHFLETIVPNFTKSLSQTLKQYAPLAGNLIFPPNSALPEIRYQLGDSILVTIAESNKDSDFDYLTGDQFRDADEFYAFITHLPKPEYDPESGSIKVPLFAVQITLFPNTGICLGLTFHHGAGDASSTVGFIKTWSLISKLGGTDDGGLFKNCSLPYFDRSVIKDPSGLTNLYWSQIDIFKIESLPLKFPTNKVRATFSLQKHQIQGLKNLVQAKKPNLAYLSSFTITTAYIWTCMIKSRSKSGEQVDDMEPEYFTFAIDARAHLNPPVPQAYFGNCLALPLVETTHGELRGENGFMLSVELIGDVIHEMVIEKGGILKDADKWMEKFGKLMGKRLVGVAGSPKFDLYDADFGWGKAKKNEAVGIDVNGSMSLGKSREFEGGLQIGLSLTKERMEAFEDLFYDGLEMIFQ